MPWVGRIPWRRAWQPSPVCLPEKCHGLRSLADCGPGACRESDMTEKQRSSLKRFQRLNGTNYIKQTPWQRKVNKRWSEICLHSAAITPISLLKITEPTWGNWEHKLESARYKDFLWRAPQWESDVKKKYIYSSPSFLLLDILLSSWWDYFTCSSPVIRNIWNNVLNLRVSFQWLENFKNNVFREFGVKLINSLYAGTNRLFRDKGSIL